MKKHFTMTAIAAGAAVCFSAGAAQAETRDYDLSGFTMIDASEGVPVEISVGGDFSVRAEGDSDKLDRLRLENKSSTLHLDRTRDGGWFKVNRRSDFTVYVTMPSLDGVDVSSGAEVSARSIDADLIRVSVSSGADAVLSGQCNTIEADGSSGADLDAEDLRCNDAVADVSSGADIIVFASQSVRADASSGGDITVYGGPERTNVDESSGGDVHIK
ncbi:head GIN domain-containing protein [Hyphococcus sp.]|uniref:head GIN domain-containing protein n=1 Tax=Hyphococcus sp. TaxID=2038636 RepID=UPI003CCB7FD8